MKINFAIYCYSINPRVLKKEIKYCEKIIKKYFKEELIGIITYFSDIVNKKDNRKGLEELICSIEKQDIHCIVIPYLDVFSNEKYDLIKQIDKIPFKRCKIVICNEECLLDEERIKFFQEYEKYQYKIN